jgi:AcrR family transcriptional regulator
VSSDFRISLQLLWGRRERNERGPKPGLTVERIVAAAIELADAEGLDAASMRRVADRLGVGAMSLYRYVPGKAELLELMLDAVHWDDTAPPEAEWRERVAWLAHRSRARIRRHPWMLQVVVGQRPPLGPNIIGEFDAYLQAVSGIGLTAGEMVAATELVGLYVQGATRADVEAATTARESGVSDEQWWGERQEFWDDYFDPKRFPAISAVWDSGGYEEGVDSFEFGLQRILDGIEALLAGR